MTSYIMTITLRNALPADFDNLERGIAIARFAFIKKKNTGQPNASVEYSLRSALSLPEVIEAAYHAAKRTGKDYSLTVMKKLIAA